jgi:hypothetical protein
MSSAEYIDDPSIKDEDKLWRRIPPRHVFKDENLQKTRPSSAAFEDHPNGSPMSVFVERLVREADSSEMEVMLGHEEYALVAITAGFCRKLNLKISLEPHPDTPGHAVVFGNKTGSVKRKLAMEAIWIIPPTSEACS